MSTTLRRLFERLAPALGVLSIACGEAKSATPLPEPPMMDLSKVSESDVIVTLTGPQVVAFTAEPGSTAPNATVHVTNLDSTDPVVATTADANGGFTITVSAAEGNTLRFQAIAQGVRGAPADGRLGASAILTPVVRPACVGVSPGYDLDFAGGIASLSATLTNQCTADITVSGATLRLGLVEFTPEASLAAPLPVGQSTSRTVSFTKSTRVEPEDVLFIDVQIDPTTTVRYPFTVHGE